MADWSSQIPQNSLRNFDNDPVFKKRRLIRHLKLALVASILFGAIGFSAKPAYLFFRERRIDRNLDEAKQFSRLGDWGKARDRARSVLLARESDFEAYRIWATALGKMGEPRAYMAAAQLFMSPKSLREDRLSALRTMAMLAPQAVALGAYGSLEEQDRTDVSFRAAITPLLVRRGEVDLAEKGLRESMKPDPSPHVELELLRVLCAKPEPQRVEEARSIFSNLIRDDFDSEALSALSILAETPGGLAPGEPLPDLVRWISELPDATTLQRLYALHPAMQSIPETSQNVYTEAIRRFGATDPGVVGTWLIRNNQTDLALSFLEVPSQTRSDAYIARLNALLRADRTGDVDEALKVVPDSVDLVEVELIKAAIAWKKGDQIASQAAWIRSLNQASFDTTENRYIEIAQAAQSFGAAAATQDAWVAAIRSGWGQLPLYIDVLPILESLAIAGRSEDLFAVCRTLNRFEPYNSDLINNVQYLGLIHDVFTPDQVLAVLSTLAAEHPEMPEIESALMLAELMMDRPLDSLKRLEAVRKTNRVSPMMIAALEGTSRIMAGETQTGSDILRNIKWEQFMRQERFVFRNLLVKLKVSSIPLPEFDEKVPESTLEDTPAWRKAVERSEKARSEDVLPALPPSKIKGSEPPLPGN